MIFETNEQKKWTTAEDTADYIAQNIDESYFNAYLDKKREPIELDGKIRRPSGVMKKVSKTTYQKELQEFRDQVYYDVLSELNAMKDNEILPIYGFEVRSYDDKLHDYE